MIRTVNKVALYARFSSDNQRSESIDAQMRAMEAYCKQHGFVIVERYIDEAKSATIDRRPAFQRLIADSNAHTFNIVLVHKLDRFARNRYDSAVYKRELKKNGVTVYSVLENLDDSPESIMMESVLEGMAEYYSFNLAREVMKGLRETAIQCKHTGSKPPLGYDIDPVTKRLVINEEEADTVRIIFDMCSRGYGYSAILDRLHELGRKTKLGRGFQKNSLYGILGNQKYMGTFVFNRASAKDAMGRRNTHLYKDDDDIVFVEGGCPQIIDSDTYAKVQAIITERKHTGGRSNARETYLLSGKVYCHECGKSMVGNSRYSGRNKRLYVTYRCPSRKYVCPTNKEINRDYLESYVVNLIEREILNTRSLKRICREIEKYAETVQIPAESHVERERREIDEALKNVADAIENGLISDVLIARLKELESRKAELDRYTTGEVYNRGNTAVDPALILAEYAEVRKSPGSMQYKEFIRGFIYRIEVSTYQVRITLNTGLDIFPELNRSYDATRREVYDQRKTV